MVKESKPCAERKASVQKFRKSFVERSMDLPQKKSVGIFPPLL